MSKQKPLAKHAFGIRFLTGRRHGAAATVSDMLRSEPASQRISELLHRLNIPVYAWISQLQRSKVRTVVEPPTARTVARFQAFSRWSSILAVVVGYHVWLGWVFDIGILTAPSPHLAPMRLGAASCSLLAGIALLWSSRGRWDKPLTRWGFYTCAAGVGLSALLAVADGFFQLQLGFGHSFQDGWESTPARMALMSSLGFLMLSIALLCMHTRKYFRYSEWLALASGALSLLVLAGYLYGAEKFQRQTPLYTAVVTFLLSAAILCARVDRGFMAKVASDSFGGVMARRLLPATLLIPLTLGFLTQQGEHARFYDSAPGFTLFAIGNVLVFLLVVWWGVNSLHRMDTQRRKTEHDLQDTAAKLARSNADLEQFAYVASHDLKEPLRAITGSVQILQTRYKDKLDRSADVIIQHTAEGAVRMQNLIDDLLTYSRLTAREAPLVPVNTAEVLQEALTNLGQSLSESKAVVTSDPLPVVPGDRIQLLQVFQNLLSNAIKYRSQRTPKVHVSAEDHGSEWLFSVRDNGIGIAAQYAERIFRIFQRLHTRADYSGTGIGLAICKKIIERHGGRIWVESEPEEGSTFFFTLAKV